MTNLGSNCVNTLFNLNLELNIKYYIKIHNCNSNKCLETLIYVEIIFFILVLIPLSMCIPVIDTYIMRQNYTKKSNHHNVICSQINSS